LPPPIVAEATATAAVVDDDVDDARTH
jgi:hypothetical protein